MRRLLFQGPAVRSCPTWEQGPGFPTPKARLEKPGRGRSQRQQDAADWASRTTGVSPSQFRRWEVHVQGACGSVSGDALFLTRRRPPSSCVLAWQRASPTLRTSSSPTHPQRPIRTHHRTGLGLQRTHVSVRISGHVSAGGCVLHPERMALHRLLVPSCPTAWLTEQVTCWGASCVLHLSWPSNPCALESGQAGLEVGPARAGLAS